MGRREKKERRALALALERRARRGDEAGVLEAGYLLEEWTPFLRVEMPAGLVDAHKALGHNLPHSCWLNSLYQVLVYDVTVPWTTEGLTMTWLSIKRRDKAWMHDWRHLQRIKNELVGPEREAVELYPAESRLVDTSNQYHLWCLPAGLQFPFGYRERLVMGGQDVDVPGQARQRPVAGGPDGT